VLEEIAGVLMLASWKGWFWHFLYGQPVAGRIIADLLLFTMSLFSRCQWLHFEVVSTSRPVTTFSQPLRQEMRWDPATHEIRRIFRAIRLKLRDDSK
jgi:hypothetical protein